MEQDVSVILNWFAQYAWRGPAMVGGLLLARVLPIAVLTPIFGGHETPRRFRLGVAIVLAMVLAPSFAGEFGHEIPLGMYGLLLAKEAFVGLGIAVAVSILFEMIAALGTLTDLLRDANLLNVFDPVSREQTSPLSLLIRRMAVVMFFVLGGHRLLLGALGDSFAAVPLMQMPARTIDPAVTIEFVTLFGDLIVVAVKLAAPVVVLMLAVELAYGLLTRVSPALEISILTRMSKATLGLWVFLLILGYGFERVLGSVLERLLRFVTAG